MTKYLLASGFAAAALAAGSLVHAQPVENTRPPLFATQDGYGDASQSAREAAVREKRQTRRPDYGLWMYDSHNPEANSARWGVGG